MTTNTDPVRAHKPCGGCGNADPEKVCFGCRHDFGEALASAPPAEAQAQGGGEVAWRVPVLQSPFGERLDHGVRDELVLVMHRGAHGWKAAGQGHALLAHQLYVKNLGPLCAASHEVAVVGLSGGGWRTVWARSDDDVTHPAPPSAPAGGEAGRLADDLEAWAREPFVALTPMRRMDVEGFAKRIRALSQQPAAGEEIMVNAAHDVYTLPLQPSGLLSGPRFVVHVPAPEQPPAAPSGEAVAPAEGIIERLEAERDRCDNLAASTGNSLTRQREARLANYFDWAVREIRRLAALAAQQQGGA